MGKLTEYPQATQFDNGDILIKDGPNGTKKILVADAFAGTAENSKAIAGLKKHNAYDVLSEANRPQQAPYSGISFDWLSNGSCYVHGTSTGACWINMYDGSTAIPSWITPGGTYYVKYSAAYTRFIIYGYYDGTLDTDHPIADLLSDDEVTIPSDVTGLQIRLHVASGLTVRETVNPIMLTAAANQEIGELKDELDVMTRIDYEFTLQSYVDANGTITDPRVNPNIYMSRTQRIPCGGGDLVIRNTQNSDNAGKHFTIYVAEFNGTVFQKRTEMLARGTTLTIGDTTDNIIICFGRYGSSGITISQEDIDAYFDMSVYRKALSVSEFEEYIENDSFYNRGNVIDLGFTSFAECVLPGLYTFSTGNLASISDEPPGLNAGGLLIVYNAGSVIWQEIHSTYYEFIRYGASGTWIDKHDYVRAAYSGTAGDDDSTESINIFLPRGVDGRKVRYNLGHCVNTSINANVWRITYLFSLAAHQTGGTQMTRKGEFECAVHLANRDDFSGGWVHGDEVDQSVTFLGDGKVMTAANVNGFYKEFKVIRNSILYDPADHTTAIAEHGVEYIFTPDGLTINQSVKWLVAATLTTCYLAMLPIYKTFSTYRYDDTSFKVVQNTQDRYSVTIPGAKSVTEYIDGIATTMSIGTYPEGLTGGDCALVTDNGGENYNKVYFVVCTSGSVTAGTLWKASTRYLVK